MAAIYYERFDVADEGVPRLVGAHVYHRASFPAMRQHGIFMCGVATPTGACEIERVQAPFHVLLVPLAGEAELFQGDDIWPVRPGQFGVLPIGGQRGFRRVGAAPMPHAWVMLRDHDRWNPLQRDTPWVGVTTESAALYEAVSLFQREAARANQGESDTLAMPALDLLSRLLQRMLRTDAAVDPRLAALQSWRAAVLHAPAQDWSIERCCARLGLRPAHLHRVCQQHFGQSPGQMVFELRMRAAREMLLAGQKVAVVGPAVGYLEVASFSRRFRQHYGIAPSELLSAMAG